MKYTFFLIAFFSFLSTSVAQNDLVFNEAKFIAITSSPTNATTVPEGKVWKIESYSTSRGNGYGGSLLVDNEPFIIPVDVPIVWIPAGTTIRSGDTSLSSGYLAVLAINVLEFNVTSASDGGGGSSGSGFSSEGLEFSNVINFESSQVTTGGSQTGTETAGSFTIPDGKVWKITNVMVTKQGTGGSPYLRACSCSGFIDNTIVYDNITNLSLYPQRYTPYWLTAGNHTLKISDNNSSSAGERFIISYSAIEYNLPE